MYGVLQRQEQRAGDDHQERLMLSLDKMFGRETDDALVTPFDYWRSMQTRRAGLPIINDFKPRELLPPTVARRVSWVDLITDDPFNFVYRQHAGLTAFGDHSDRRVGDHPSQMNAKSLAFDH